ncbi:secretion protein HlyD family protein [Stanieria cyanosphaera PCC 7437]|uniref:Secretion protein HlyD family protein n=1 Tax=Stanieria cyanosphaera (strain ATCC 29371 / PCC 7437) TaxID=111780 RepID=K9XSA0_STAC7|nr:HlyD family efflux transporter periplasmic adaptor subunit [Stanieria cyanosphaera]AFZ34959.1 secretion protein HlyD family protein [Stanieria cyanosphaera PCC 7437]
MIKSNSYSPESQENQLLEVDKPRDEVSLYSNNTSTSITPVVSDQETRLNSWSPSFHTFLEQPPATFPVRVLIGGIIFSSAFVLWAWLGQVEDVGQAKGKLVPEGKTYKVQPIEVGQAVQVLVEEGQPVKAGDILVKLDAKVAQQEVNRLKATLQLSQQELLQKQALKNRILSEAKTNEAIASANLLAQQQAIAISQEKTLTTRQLLEQQQAEALAYQDRQAKMQPLSGMAQQRLDQLYAEMKAHQQRMKRLTPLADRGAVSQEYIFQAEQALRDTQQRITQSQLQEMTNASEQVFQANQSLRDLEAKITQNKGELATNLEEIKQLQAELTQKRAEREQIRLETQQKVQQLDLEIIQLESKIAETKNLLATARTKLAQFNLKAPVDGTVLTLNLQNTGEVVQPGDTVIEIAPEGANLMLSATLPNQEAGFVTKGMPVKIKLDAYPYQDYGVINGTVESVSADAKSDEKLGEIYQLDIALDKNYIKDRGKQIEFKAGQTATADIIIRHRRIADILIDPIRQLQKDGVKL